MLLNKENCTGCGACENICSVNAVKMEVKSGDGFWYPVVNNELCVSCGMCESVCTALHPEKIMKIETEPKAFVVQNKDKGVLKTSAAGGAFSALAEQIIKRNGVVFGAAIDDSFTVKHKWIDTADGIAELRQSKYVQSEIGNTFSECKNFLESGKPVLFCGTPCQISGLHAFLGKKYKNLFTMDVRCHSIPSPVVFSKYMSWQLHNQPDIKRISFRDKYNGYSYSTVAMYDGNENCVYRKASEADPWLRLFHSRKCSRLSCYDCQYQKSEARSSDISVWDNWNANVMAPSLDNNLGTTNVVCRTENGIRLFKYAENDISFVSIPFKRISGHLTKTVTPVPTDRKKLLEDAECMSGTDFINKYAPMSIKFRLLSLGRYLLYKTHLHDSVRRFTNRLKRR